MEQMTEKTGHGDCPCREAIRALETAYYSKEDGSFRRRVDAAFEHMQPLPPENPGENFWIGKQFSDLVRFLEEWCTFLPGIHGSHSDGLKYIEIFGQFYYKNPDGVAFVQDSPGREIMQAFAKQRGAFMESPASGGKIAEWLADERTERDDYVLPDPDAADGGFDSFNAFFVRTLKAQDESRPQTMPERDYVIGAPADCILNSVPLRITDAKTPIPTKGGQELNISELLDHSVYAERFVGGTALSCVLMPGAYHRYHAPVGGRVVESRIIEDAYYGYDDFPTWEHGGNVGYYGTEFGQFASYKRGYFIVDTGKYGHVALVAVGLDTISSIVFIEKFSDVTAPVPVVRGEELGHFRYGGSLFIMIFEPGRYHSDAIQVRLGNQIGMFDTQESDPE
ncbi:MAG: phosphatidylserine decarboxylase [Campylobacterales bacterium]